MTVNPQRNPNAKRGRPDDLSTEGRKPSELLRNTDMFRATVRRVDEKQCRIWISSDYGAVTITFSSESSARKFTKKINQLIEEAYSQLT